MEKKQLIRAFHSVCYQYGITPDMKQAIYSGFGTDSSRNLSEDELQKAIDAIGGEANKWRSRVIAAIGGYLTRNKIENNIDMIKAIACRAAKTDDFNHIAISDLRRLYNLFTKKGATVGGRVTNKEQVINHFEALNSIENEHNN